jgi:hypothetical protein
MYVSDNISSITPYMFITDKNISNKSVEKIETHFMINTLIFFKIIKQEFLHYAYVSLVHTNNQLLI